MKNTTQYIRRSVFHHGRSTGTSARRLVGVSSLLSISVSVALSPTEKCKLVFICLFLFLGEGGVPFPVLHNSESQRWLVTRVFTERIDRRGGASGLEHSLFFA